MSSPEPQAHGVLPVDKPVGPTSHDIVAMTRRALRTRRVGHTGTLDPFASGLLLLCVGTATRVAEYLTGLDKEYRATVRLGTATDTDDATGTPLRQASAAGVTLAALNAAIAPLVGEVLQTPPAYSAKKREGVRAHTAARAGQAFDLPPVLVRINRIAVLRYEAPDVDIEVACGSGTYIRAIARDIGEALGVGAHLTALRRTRVGRFMVDDALTPGALDDPDAVGAAMLAPAAALDHMPSIAVDEQSITAIRHGRAVPVPAQQPGPLLLCDAGGGLVAVAEQRDGLAHPRKVFS